MTKGLGKKDSMNSNRDIDGAKEALTYAQAGVDTAEGARAVDAIGSSVRATYRPEVIGDIGGFGGLFSAAKLKDMADPVLVSGADGVGTKIEIAREMNIFDTVGIDLVAMCVNDVLACGAEPLFFLDYIATGKIESERMTAMVAGVAEGCVQAGCALIGGEMAEHPGVMDDGAFDMSGFCVAAADKSQMVDGSQIEAGDVIFGLPSSGLHSNGFSLVRRVVADLDLGSDFQDSEQTLGEVLLTPTRIYVKLILDLLKSGVSIKGMAHITGGGITENLDRILPDGMDAAVSLGSWEMPPIIQFICEQAQLETIEALRTFNCGVGYALAVSAADAPILREALDGRDEPYFEIGHIVPGSGTVRYCDE